MTAGAIGDDDDEALRVVRAAFGALEDGDSAPSPQPLALDDLPVGPGVGSAPRLIGFGRMAGVGAVAPEEELRFAPDGLTIIYGPNAAGETTYVRGLKRVCRTVDCDVDVRGNVFVVATVPDPTAKVELLIGGEQRAQQLDLTDPSDLGLDAVSVFDSRCAELYVDAQNAVAYVPSALVCDFFARRRTSWERAVEQRLFRGVVQRFEREVKTLALDSVSITPELVATIQDGMTRCSHFVHDASPATGSNLPGRAQLAEDLAKLQEFEKRTRS